jgi:cob(I)alamin adenosyltransferase
MEFNIVTTKNGDEGKTSLFDGKSRFKSEPVFDLLGDLDELNSFIGLAKSHVSDIAKYDEIVLCLEYVQRKIIDISAKIAGKDFEPISPEDIDQLELYEKIAIGKTKIEPKFAIPGNNSTSAHFDVIRTITRRCERNYIGFCKEPDDSIAFLNRLSDYFFVIARYFEVLKKEEKLD